MGNLRNEILNKGLPTKENSRIFKEIVESPILDDIGRGNWDDVASNLNRILHSHMSPEDVLTYTEVR